MRIRMKIIRAIIFSTGSNLFMFTKVLKGE